MKLLQDPPRWLKRPWVPPQMGKSPYLWPVFLVFFLAPYALAPFSMAVRLAALASALLMLALYFISLWAGRRQLLLCIAGSCALGLGWAPHNGGASVFFVFAAGMCAGFEAPGHGYATLAAIMLVAGLQIPLHRAGIDFLLPVFVVGSLIGISGIMNAGLQRSRHMLLRKQEEIEHLARIAERERISRDLHDLLGHTLSLITLKAELAGKLLSRDTDACRLEIRDIETSARHALAEVRSAVTGYRQSGFAHELGNAKTTLAAANIELQASVPPFTLPATLENVLALALREAITNIVRHSQASRCQLELTLHAAHLHLRIADNGRFANDALRFGNGLIGMQERLQALGGHLQWQCGTATGPMPGLILDLNLPLGALT